MTVKGVMVSVSRVAARTRWPVMLWTTVSRSRAQLSTVPQTPVISVSPSTLGTSSTSSLSEVPLTFQHLLNIFSAVNKSLEERDLQDKNRTSDLMLSAQHTSLIL